MVVVSVEERWLDRDYFAIIEVHSFPVDISLRLGSEKVDSEDAMGNDDNFLIGSARLYRF